MDLWLWLSSSNHRLLNVRSPGLNPLALDTRVAGSLTDKDPIAATQRLCCSPLSPSQDSGAKLRREGHLAAHHQAAHHRLVALRGWEPKQSVTWSSLGNADSRAPPISMELTNQEWGPAICMSGRGSGGGPPGNSDACSNLRASGYHRRKGAVGKPELNPDPTY